MKLFKITRVYLIFSVYSYDFHKSEAFGIMLVTL